MRDSKPSCWFKRWTPSIILVPNLIIESKVKVFRDVSCFSSDLCDWYISSWNSSCRWVGKRRSLRHLAHSIVLELLWHALFNYHAIPLASQFSDDAFTKILIVQVSLTDMVVNVVSTDLFHKFAALHGLFFGPVKSESFWHTKFLTEQSQSITRLLFRIHGVDAGKITLVGKYLGILITLQWFAPAIHRIGRPVAR